MLSKEAINSALPLATVFDDRKLIAMPVAGSPLAMLVEATRSDDHFVSNVGDGTYDVLVDEIEYIANAKDPVLHFSPHDKVMDEITSVCIAAVQGHIAHARSVVAPAIQEMVEKTAAAVQALTPSALLGMEVVAWRPPAPMDVAGFETMARRFEETPFDVPQMVLNCPTLSAKEILELMFTGSSTVDTAIADWAATKGDSFFLQLWEDVFQIVPVALNKSPKTFRDYTEDRHNGLDHAVAIFLLARKLVDSPIDGIDMPAARFESVTAAYRNQAGARICRGFEELNSAAKNGQLVRSVEGNRTCVFDAVYRDWLDKGGSNEVLFGNLLDYPYASLVDSINTRASTLKAKWDTHAALTKLTESNRNFYRTKEILRSVFENQVCAIIEGEESNEAHRLQVMRLFDDQLHYVRTEELEDLWGLCLRLVCRARFYRTDAERILAGIEQVKKQSPQIDVREAAAASMTSYVAHWVASQIRVESV